MNSIKRSQSGLALIIVLMITGALTGVNLTQTSLIQEDIRDSASRKKGHALYYAALQGEAVAMAELTVAFEDNQALPQKVPNLSASTTKNFYRNEKIQVSVTIVDLQSRFNLNTLVSSSSDRPSEATQRIFRRYCLTLPIEAKNCASLYEAASKTNAYRSDFTGLFQTLNAMLESGRTNSRQLAVIASAFSTLPRSSPININTAPTELLQAINPEVRTKDTEPNLSLFSQRGVPIATGSQYFAVYTTVGQGVVNRAIQSVIFLDPTTGEAKLIYRRLMELPNAVSLKMTI